MKSVLTVSSEHFRNNRMSAAMAISLLLHLIVLVGLTFQFPKPLHNKISTSLEVVLVNKQTPTKPTKTQLLAQDNLDGGGNTDKNRQAKTPFPILPKNKPLSKEAAAQKKVEQLEEEAKKLMAAVSTKPEIKPIEPPKDKPNNTPDLANAIDAHELLSRSLDIARLKAQVDQDYDEYQKRPKRKFVGARTKEYRFARYVEDWRIKVERIGNLNYPEEARKGKLYGNLQLTVSIRADGSLESIEINRSSGKKILDNAAINIVKLSGQNGFAPFPPNISQDTDILHITRTWVFAPSDTLISR